MHAIELPPLFVVEDASLEALALIRRLACRGGRGQGHAGHHRGRINTPSGRANLAAHVRLAQTLHPDGPPGDPQPRVGRAVRCTPSMQALSALSK
jgi:hypothetical protein